MGLSITKREIKTLKEFYALMAETRAVKADIVGRMAEGADSTAEDVEALESALACLEGITKEGKDYQLEIAEGTSIAVNLDYEIGELQKDSFFLRYGEDKFLVYLSTLSQGFFADVKKVQQALDGRQYNAWITDRDGTTNNYCGRYNSSVQSVYNALWLTKFARAKTKSPVFITSAPLQDMGIVDVSVNPDKAFVYAASKGREFIDYSGVRRTYGVDEAKQALLDSFNKHMEAVLRNPKYERFSLIGSGYQRKFGQTTIARQDITQSIEPEYSEMFLKKVHQIVDHVDKEGGNFVIEDTGLDVEVILTVEGEGGMKDFDKEEGVYFLDETLRLDMTTGPNLISGDTRSDLPLVRAGMNRCTDTWSVFVTKDPQLEADVRAICPNTIIAPTPDVLVTALAQLSKR